MFAHDVINGMHFGQERRRVPLSASAGWAHDGKMSHR